MRKYILPILAPLFALCLSGQAPAQDFDGSKPFICAIIETFECEPGGQCEEQNIHNLDIPQFFRFDFKEKTISGTNEDGTIRTTKIEEQVSMEGKLILQGAQNGRGWSIVISEETGKMTLTASDDQAGFVVFGACLEQ